MLATPPQIASARTQTINGKGKSPTEIAAARRRAVTRRAIFALIAAPALAALIVFFGPAIAELAIVKMLGAEADGRSAEAVFTVIVFGTMLLIGFIGGATSRVDAVRLGTRPILLLLLSVFVGLFGVTVTTGYSAIVGTLKVGEPVENTASVLLAGAGLVLLQAAAEEIYFRGWLQRAVAKAWGTSIGVTVAAVAFAALHILGGAREPLSLINLFLGGLLFGILAAYGRGVIGAIAAHFAWNGTEQLILGLDPNPGVGSFGSLFNFDLVGAASWGGAEEGLNASFAMTITLFAVLLPLIFIARRTLADPDAPLPKGS